MKEKITPSEEQLMAVCTYAEKHGRDWKEKLNNAWLNGSDANEPNGHLLRQVRNQFGPSWLAEFNLGAKPQKRITP